MESRIFLTTEGDDGTKEEIIIEHNVEPEETSAEVNDDIEDVKADVMSEIEAVKNELSKSFPTDEEIVQEVLGQDESSGDDNSISIAKIRLTSYVTRPTLHAHIS